MLHAIYGTENANRHADIIFVHGLNPWGRLNADHAFKTWGMKRGAIDGWPKELGDLLQNAAETAEGLEAPSLFVGVWLFEFDASALAIFGSGLSLDDIAGKLFGSLEGRGLNERPIIFVAHSLGGLVVKHTFQRAHTLKIPEEQWFYEKLKGVVFLGTPHNGAGLARYARIALFLFGPTPAVRDLLRNTDVVLNLSKFFRNIQVENPVHTVSYYEDRNTYPFVRIVDKEAADVGIPNHPHWSKDGNHFQIASNNSEENLTIIANLVRKSLANPT